MQLMLYRRRNLRPKPGEHGYVLLTLLLVIALLIIGAATLVTSISFDIKRDREEELIHRGVQYSRAIRAYYKKFGRYPAKLEDLESANNMRFLRKRYKDPITGKDFKLLHFGEVKMVFTGAVVGTGINGTNALSNANLVNNANPLVAQAVNAAVANAASGYGPQAAPGLNSNPTNPASTDNSSADQPNADGSSQTPGQPNSGTASRDQLAGTTFGGAPVVGVVSLSKKDTIREFNHKKKYNEWQFIYDPGTDRGGLLMTPNQPPLQGFGQQGFGQQGMQNLNGQATGNSFNNSPGLQGSPNNLSSPSGSQPGTQNEPSNPPQQQ